MEGTFNDRLKEYLNKIGRNRVSLSFDEIRSITGIFPQEAYFVNWWSNNPFITHATGWLDAGYEVINPDRIETTHIVAFQKYSGNHFKRLFYSSKTISISKKIFTAILTTLIVTIIGKELILPRVVEGLGLFWDIPVELEQLRNYYEAGDYEEVKEYIKKLRPKVENGIYRSTHKSISAEQLAEILSYDFIFTFDDYTNGEYLGYFNELKDGERTIHDYYDYFSEHLSGKDELAHSEWKYLERLARKGITYSEEARTPFYRTLFYRYLCELNLFQFSRTMDEHYSKSIMNDSYAAFIEYGRDMGINIRNDVDLMISKVSRVLTKTELKKASEMNRINLIAFQCCYQVILNGMYSIDDLFSEMSWTKIVNQIYSPSDTAFVERFVTIAEFFGPIPLMSIYYSTEKADIDSESNAIMNTSVLEFLTMASRYLSTIYLSKSITDPFDRNFFDLMITSLPGLLEQSTDWAKSIHRYDILADIYFEISRLHFTIYKYSGEEAEFVAFRENMEKWLNFSNQPGISFRIFNKYFIDVGVGEILDLYISQLDELIHSIDDPWNTDPLYYASICRELAMNLYSKAKELENHNTKEAIEVLKKSKEYCNEAMMYFTETVNYPLNQSLSLLLEEIDTEYNRLVLPL